MPNLATADATNTDPPVSDPGSITCLPPALLVVKTPDGATINAGDTATFTIVVSNTGAGPALGVTLTDPLPAGGGVNWQTSTAGCSITGVVGTQTLTCTLGDIAAGAAAPPIVVHGLTSFTACTAMPNLATASATNAPNAQDPGSITCNSPGLNVVKTPDGQTINAGDTATFTIVVSNTGASPALGVTLSDPLPAGGGVNWQTSSAGCSITGAAGTQTLTCTFGDIAAGAVGAADRGARASPASPPAR